MSTEPRMSAFYANMKPFERLNRVANRSSSVTEVYRNPAELVADLAVTLPQLSSANDQLERAQRSIRRIMNARESISADLSLVFAKWSNVLHEEAETLQAERTVSA
jgi:hypothetical protein